MVLTWLANIGLRRLRGVRGTVKWVRIKLMAPGIALRDLSQRNTDGRVGKQRIEVGSIAIDRQWRALATGKLLPSVRVESPRSFLDLRGIIDRTAGIDVRSGVLGVYVEPAAADGHIQGYA